MLPLIVAALVAAAPSATPAPTPTPRQFTPSMESSITSYARRIANDRRAPGFAIGIVENGRVVYERGFGYADLATRTPFTPATQFDAAGVGRSIAAGAVLIAQQDGKLKLDDPLSKYVPAATGSTTVAGFLRTEFDQRTVAALVEKAAGIPYSDFLQQRIFAPLIMTQTVLASDTGASNLAVGYSGFLNHFSPVHLDGKTDDIITSVADVEKWDVEFPILLRVDAVREMFTATTVGLDETAQLGMGWHIDQRGGKSFVWQNGRASGYRSMNALLPDDHVAVIVATNVDDRRDGRVASPEAIASYVLDVVDPPQEKRLSNVIVERATDWLNRLADGRIDRTQLTPDFSAYLTDTLVARENFASLGKLQAIVPVASWKDEKGDTIYEFIVHYPHDTFHYRFGVTADGKIDTLFLVP